MQRLLVIITICLFGILPGCASVAGFVPFAKDESPAARQPFNNIEIPSGMSPVAGGYSTAGPDGQTNGLACYEGYIQPANLQYDLDVSMRGQGWKAVSGAGTPKHLLAVYTREKLYAVLNIRALAAGTALDVWVGSALKDGHLPLPFSPVQIDKGGAAPSNNGVVEGGGSTINTAPVNTPSTRHASGLQEKEL